MNPNKAKRDVFVGSLPPDSTQESVKSLFSSFGPISNITVQDGSGKYRGTKRAFVRFLYDYDSDKAVSDMHGFQVGSYTLKVFYPDKTRDEHRKSLKIKGGPGGDARPIKSEASVSYENSSQPTPIRKEKVFVTYVDTPCSFYTQQLHLGERIMELSELMLSVGPSSQSVKGRPLLNKIYGTPFSEDGMWYRCVPLEYVSETKVKVKFIDYGNNEVKDDCELVELHTDLLAKQQGFAQHCVLYGMKPASSNSSSVDFKAGIEHFRKVIGNGIIDIAVVFEQEHCLFVDASVDGCNINDEMLKLNFATNRPTLSKPPNPGSPQRLVTHPRQNNGGRELNQGDSQLEEQLRVAQNEIMNLTQELSSIRDERHSLLTDLSTSKGRIKTLQAEYNNLNLTLKLKGVLSKVTQVKKYRRLFPTDSDIEDLIQTAIDLANDDESRIRLDALRVVISVNEALGVYNHCQQEIRQCSSASQLDTLIKARDNSRVTLHEMLENFIREVAILPLGARSEALRNSIKSLSENYSSFLDFNTTKDLTLDKCLPIYLKWKAEKNEILSSVRTCTNTRHNAVESALRLLQQQLSLDLKSSDTSPHKPINLDQLVTRLSKDFSDEIECSNMEANGSDTVILSSMVHCLLAEMQEELMDIDKLTSLFEEYKLMIVDISEWLTTKPDITGLQVVRKTIKNLKSKLRHKLADKQDMEDSEESDQEGMQEIKIELTNICRQLHKAFIEEDRQLCELSRLWKHHFPELVVRHTEVCVPDDASLEGLVKSGRDLDQYVVEERWGREAAKNVIKTEFNGQPVVLKEYIIDSSKRQVFTSNAVNYHNVSSDHTVALDFVFFNKNACQAYVQFSHLQSLTKRVSSTDQPLTRKEKYDVLTGVLQGLADLHKAGVVHAAIHPGNVFVRDGQGLLGDFNFTLSETQRAHCGPTTVNGLKFVAPEVWSDCANEKTDMFCFGLLILWVHYPLTSFEVINGIPDLSAITQADPLADVLRSLLVVDPRMRPNTAELKKLTYFTSPPETLDTSPVAPVSDTLQLRRTSPPLLRMSSGSPVSILKNGGSSPPVVSTRTSPPLVVTTETSPPQAVTTATTGSQTIEQLLPPPVSIDTEQAADGAVSDASSVGSLLDQDVPHDSDLDLLVPVAIKDESNLEEARRLVNEAMALNSDSEGLSSKTSSFEILTEETSGKIEKPTSRAKEMKLLMEKATLSSSE